MDSFVIKNLLKPKGIGSQFGRASATLDIEDVVLVDTIPERIRFSNPNSYCREEFGVNSKVLPNLNTLLLDLRFLSKIANVFNDLRRAGGVRVRNSIRGILDRINMLRGSKNNLIDRINDEELEAFRNIPNLQEIVDSFRILDFEFRTEVEYYLVAIQLIWYYNRDVRGFKNAYKYSSYLLEKENFDRTLRHFNCT